MKRTIGALGTLALTAVLGVVLPASVAPPAGAANIGCGFLAQNLVSVPIPDHGTATSTTDLTGLTTDDPLIDLDVTINITHPVVGNLVVTLSYGHYDVLLTSRHGGGGDNYTDTRFNDGATDHIRDGSAPFTGQFRPEQSLNAFDDLDPGGVWTLTVTDAVTNGVGTLNSWGLTFRTQWCNDLDRDTVKDADDQCSAVWGIQPHGCPERARELTIFYKASTKDFRGTLKCQAAPRCRERQPVRIYQVAPGEDPLVGRTYADETGLYVLHKTGVSGQYYAVAPRVYEEGVAECMRVQSANLTI
jgi:subtilisin-like proprotein convertase family protein